MFGIAVLFFIFVYLLISLIVIRVAVVVARRFNRRGWLWGVFAGLFMYNLVLWDAIPSYVLFKYYCNKDAGVTLYVDAEQWIKEHPEAMQPFKYEDLPWEYKTRVKETKTKDGKHINGNVDFKLPNGERWHVNYNEDLKQKTKKVERISVSKPDGTRNYYLTKSVVSVSMPIKRYWFGIVKSSYYIEDVEVNRVLATRIDYSNDIWLADVIDFNILDSRCEIDFKKYINLTKKIEGVKQWVKGDATL